MEIITKSAEATRQLGKKISANLLPNDVIGLKGQLGAGKTTLIQGIAQGLKIKDYVSSPTFIIVNEHPGRLPLFHIDLYRLNDKAAIEDLGLDEYFTRGGVCLIEWAERMEEMLPKSAQVLTIDYVDELTRKISLSDRLATNF